MINKQNGFTLLEIISILIILGILAVVAVSRSVNFNAEVYSGADALKAHLRYAQTMAMNSYFDPSPIPGLSSLPYGIRCNGTSYWLFKGTNSADTTNYIRLPEDEQYINANTINLTAKKISVDSFTVYFDNRGIPYNTYNSAIDNSPLTALLDIAVTASGTTKNVEIRPLTGYIP